MCPTYSRESRDIRICIVCHRNRKSINCIKVSIQKLCKLCDIVWYEGFNQKNSVTLAVFYREKKPT